MLTLDKQLKIIGHHLSPDEGSFVLHLHEDLFFDVVKFNELLSAIKWLKINHIDPMNLGSSFIGNIFDKVIYLYDILRDLYVHPNKLNITADNYYEFLLELKYEISALFDSTISNDYNGNEYNKLNGE